MRLKLPAASSPSSNISCQSFIFSSSEASEVLAGEETDGAAECETAGAGSSGNFFAGATGAAAVSEFPSPEDMATMASSSSTLGFVDHLASFIVRDSLLMALSI